MTGLPTRTEPGMLTVRMLADRVGLCLNNEADLTNQLEIRRALAALPPTAMVHLELAGLTFIDIAATRELIGPTQQPPHPRLILHHPPPVLERLISLLWPDANAELHASANHRSEPEPSSRPEVAADGVDGLSNSVRNRQPRTPPQSSSTRAACSSPIGDKQSSGDSDVVGDWQPVGFEVVRLWATQQ